MLPQKNYSKFTDTPPCPSLFLEIEKTFEFLCSETFLCDFKNLRVLNVYGRVSIS